MKVALFLWSMVFITLNAQNATIHYTNETVNIDGILSETIWKKDSNSNFKQHFPYDSLDSKAKTSFWLASDEKYLYAAFKCYYISKKPIAIQNLKRDFSITNNDAIILTLNPFCDGQNGFSFGVNPLNAQREGAIENGGNFGVSTNWDQVWYSATNVGENYWTAEFKIPLTSIRFVKNQPFWIFNVARLDFAHNEQSTWVRVPRNLNVSILTIGSKMIWEKQPKPKKINFIAIPYLFAAYDRNTKKITQNNGADFKVSLSSSLNLDVTINPDFAQVDVDVQQINLTQFDLFYPERRQFFIENSDLFGNFGFRGIRPFFSRRIGLNAGKLIPIAAGARITGKLSNNLRVGVMNVTTLPVSGIKATNYAVVSLQRKVFYASNIGFIALHNKEFGNKFGNAITGLEYNLQNKKNTLVGKSFFMHAFQDKMLKRAYSHASFLQYRTIKWRAEWNHEFVGKGFRAPLGFVPRQQFRNSETKKSVTREFWRLEPAIAYTIYPKSKILNKTQFGLYSSNYYDSSFVATENQHRFSINNVFQSSASFSVDLINQRNVIFLPLNFNPKDTNYLLGTYNWKYFQLFAETNIRKKIHGSLTFTNGGFYNGTKTSFLANLSYRLQPFASFNINYQTEQIKLPIGNKNLNLIGANMQLTMTTLTYLNAFIQYNTQDENTNLNLRFQWRFKQMSDLFIVYSQNYDLAWKNKNANLICKAVFWIN